MHVSTAPNPEGVIMARPVPVTRASIPLGSLTQRQAKYAPCCSACGSTRITSLSMSLTDGTPVDFTSCHVCAHRTWAHGEVELGVKDVLQRARKVA